MIPRGYREMFGAGEDMCALCGPTNKRIPQCRKNIFRNIDRHRDYHSWRRIATRKPAHVVRVFVVFAHNANDGRG